MASTCSLNLRTAILSETITEAKALAKDDFVGVDVGGISDSGITIRFYSMSSPISQADAFKAAVKLKYRIDTYYPELKNSVQIVSDKINNNDKLFILDYPLDKSEDIYDTYDFRQQVDRVETELDDYYKSFITQDSSYEQFVQSLENEKAVAIAKGLAEKFTKAFNIPYTTITAQEATEILYNTKVPYKNQGAFYYNNMVYIVGDNLNVNNILHEFGHPLVKAIAIDNPKLFDNLYDEVISTRKGYELVQLILAEYPELRSKDAEQALKEEVIVTALEQEGIRLLNKIKQDDPGFDNFMKKLLYAIKKVLKRMFNKVKLDTLSASTTLEQLAEKMILDEDFVVDMPMLSEQDFANFKKDLVNAQKAFSETKSEDLQNMINKFYSEVTQELDNLRQAPFRLKEELAGKEGEKILRGMEDSLARYQTIIARPDQADPQEIIDAMEKHFDEFNKRAQALVNNLDYMENFAERIEQVLLDMKSRDEHLTLEGISKIQYFKTFIKRNENFMKEMQKISNMDKTNEFYKKLNSVRNSTENAFRTLKELQGEFVREMIGEESAVMKKDVDDRLETRLKTVFKAKGLSSEVQDDIINAIKNTPEGKDFSMEDLYKLGLPKSLPRSWYKTIVDEVNLYFAKRLNAEQIDQFISGEREDIDTLQAFLVPYKNIDDPIIGSYAKWLSNQLSEAEIKSVRRKNQMADQLLPLLRAFGYNPNDTGQLGKALLMRDKIWVVNDEGKWEEQEVLTFINEFKNYRAEKGKLQTAFDDARESKDKVAMKNAFTALVEFDEKYMHRKYKKEYYDLQKIWKQENIVKNPNTGKTITVSSQVSFEAFLERQEMLDRLNLVTHKHFTELEDVQTYSEGDLARAEYEQLFNLKYEDGTDKQGNDLAKALLLRKYREESRKFYDFKTDETKVQQDLNAFVENLSAIDISYEDNRDAFNEELRKFEKKNFKIFYEPEYFEEKARAIESIKALTAKQSSQDVPKKLADLYSERYTIRLTKIDAAGQPNGTQYTPEQVKRLKAIEEEIEKLRKTWDSASGMTKEDLEVYNSLEKMLAAGNKLTEEQQKTYDTLDRQRAIYGLSQIEYLKLKSEFKKLAELKEVQPTEYYINTFNYLVSDMEVEPMTLDSVNSILSDMDTILKLRSESADFDQWFIKNHYQSTMFQPGVGEVPVWKRLDIWSISKPADDKYIKKTELIHPVTKETLTIYGVPSGKYSYSVVKDQYRTIPKGANKEDYVGKVIDNKGNFLPRLDAEDKRFINEEYFQLKRENSARFNLLEKIKQLHLENQKDTTRGSKLYLDLPRYRKRSNMEYIQSGEAAATTKEKVQAVKDNVLSAFSKYSPPDKERFGLNYSADARFITTDLAGQPIDRIKISGLFNMPINSVSEEVLPAIYEYLASLNEYNQLRKTEAASKALIDVLSDPENAIKDMSKASKQMAKFSGKMSFIPKGSKNKRADAINYLIEKAYYGKANDSLSEEYPSLTKVANMMMGAASRSFIALDIPSALKNRYGMIFQSMIEASASKYLDPKSLAYGRGKAFTSMIELSSKGIYERGPQSLDMQILEYFDPITGKVKKDFGKSSSRTFIKDMVDGNFLYDFRRYAEVEASLQVFWAMMYKKKVELTHPDGSKTLIPYKDAFELDENKQLKLKQGVSMEYSPIPVEHIIQDTDTVDQIIKKYDITREELQKLNKGVDLDNLVLGDKLVISKGVLFSDFKFKIQGMGKKLNGMVGDLDSPQANKFLFYRLMFFYRKFATGMFLNRFQADMSKDNRWGHVYDWDFGTLSKGYYISAFQAIKKVVTDPANAWRVLADEEKLALGKAGAEIGGIIIISLLMSMLFGYDAGDEDRFEKMRDREEEYGLLGTLSNHALYQLMMIKQENESFIPVLGFDEWVSYTKTVSIATGPTLDLYVKIMNDLGAMAFGSDKAVYKKGVGPYPWQEEGRYKLWNHLFSIFGIKGKTYDPIHAIKSAETFQNLK